MVVHVLNALHRPRLDRTVVVVGHGAERVTKRVQDEASDLNVAFVEQRVQRGTGDAVIVGLTAFPDDDVDDDATVVVLPGDTPLLRPDTITALVAEHEAQDNAATVLSATWPTPPATAASCAGRTAGWPASSSSATRPPTSGPSTR